VQFWSSGDVVADLQPISLTLPGVRPVGKPLHLDGGLPGGDGAPAHPIRDPSCERSVEFVHIAMPVDMGSSARLTRSGAFSDDKAEVTTQVLLPQN